MLTLQRETNKFLTLAENFNNAATICLNGEILRPGAFLTALSVELYLKTFLFLKLFPSEENNTYKKIKSISPKHDLDKILEECIRIDNSFLELKSVITKYNKFSLFKYPDEIDKIIFGPEEGYEICSKEFINDIEIVKKFIMEKYKKLII